MKRQFEDNGHDADLLAKKARHNDTNEKSGQETVKIEQKKCYSQFIDAFFPEHSSEVQFDSEESLSYVTPINDALEVAEEINKMVKLHIGSYPNHFIDGTGGLGGNTLGFFKYCWNYRLRGKKITMIEVNSERYRMALHNINLFRSEIHHERDSLEFESANDNFVHWWRTKGIKYDNSRTLVFMDPPWGGQAYKEHDIIHDLYLDEPKDEKSNEERDEISERRQISLKDLTNEILKSGVMCVVLKVPHNYRDRTLTELGSNIRLRTYIMKKVKYIAVFTRKSRNVCNTYQSGSNSRRR
jgi:hypothetical protein